MKHVEGIIDKTHKTAIKNERLIQDIAHRRCGKMCPHWKAEDNMCEFSAAHTRIKLIECIRFLKAHPYLKTILKCPNCKTFCGIRLLEEVRKDNVKIMCPKCGREASSISFIATDD